MAEIQIFKFQHEGKEIAAFGVDSVEEWISRRIAEEGQAVLLPNVEDLKTKNAESMVADAYRRILYELLYTINSTKEESTPQETPPEAVKPAKLTPPEQIDDSIVL